MKDNAQSVGNLSLAHALCSAMPPPGYNRSRPHVFVLSLPDGGSYFFQAGTADLVNEWVLTCNYWAGRSSKEPLTGGVSSANYGWNDVMSDHSEDTEDLVSVMSGRSRHSARSRMSYATSLYGQNGLLGNMERSRLHDWVAPKSPTTISLLSEDAQLQALRRHVRTLEADLQSHNQLRAPMQRLVSVNAATTRRRLTHCPVPSAFCRRRESAQQLGEEVEVSIGRNSQVPDLYRRPCPGSVWTTGPDRPQEGHSTARDCRR